MSDHTGWTAGAEAARRMDAALGDEHLDPSGLGTVGDLIRALPLPPPPAGEARDDAPTVKSLTAKLAFRLGLASDDTGGLEMIRDALVEMRDAAQPKAHPPASEAAEMALLREKLARANTRAEAYILETRKKLEEIEGLRGEVKTLREKRNWLLAESQRQHTLLSAASALILAAPRFREEAQATLLRVLADTPHNRGATPPATHTPESK